MCSSSASLILNINNLNKCVYIYIYILTCSSLSILCFNYSGRYDNSFFGVSNICAWCQHVLLCYCDFCMYDSSSRITFPLKIFGRSVYEAGDIRDYNCRSLFLHGLFFFFSAASFVYRSQCLTCKYDFSPIK